MESCLFRIRNILPAVDALLSRYGSSSLRDYVLRLGQSHARGFQCNQDFISEMVAYTDETLGPELAAAISADLQEMPQVLTANHHGIDTFAQSTQSNLLFSMRKRVDGKPAKTIPVLACGSIPLNNLTYPRGLMIYAAGATGNEAGVLKLPMFPDSYKRKLVSAAGPLTAEMLNRSRGRAAKLIEEFELGQPLATTLDMVFDDFSSIGEEFRGYAQQATALNHQCWQRLFQDQTSHPELVYVELETIVSRLLQKDLLDPSTIGYQLMFDPQLRRRLIENLDGQRGCWQYRQLLARCSGSEAESASNARESTQGTMFFWGVDAKNRKVPLCLVENDSGSAAMLRGMTDRQQLWEIPFTAEDISLALQQGRLLPSIFTSYLLVSIARGVSCIGGYYQAEYLPIMRKAVVETLRSNSGETVKAFDTGKLRPNLYLSGMQAIGLKADGRLLPAGPLEIMASGGLSPQQYDQIGEISVQQSHIASLYDTIVDVAPRDCDLNERKLEISRLVHDAVAADILII